MFERLLELLLHAKSSVLAGVLVLGTTGALVTATVQNGTTTITVTQASANPSAATQVATTQTSPTANSQLSPVVQTTTITFNTNVSSDTQDTGSCSDEAHARNDLVHQVNRAFADDHTALEHMRKDARTKDARDLLDAADKQLQADRQAAVKKLHETMACDKDDEDKDEHADEDKDDHDEQGEHHSDNAVLAFLQRLLGTRTNVTGNTTTTTNTTATTNTTTSTTTVTGSDAKAIADEAIAAMKKVVDDAKASLAKLQVTTPKPATSFRTDRAPRTPEPRKDGKSGEHGDHD